MLAPRASNAFVCTQCELQLARRRLPAYFPTTSRARFSVSARRRDGADELEAQLAAPPSGVKITREIQRLDRVRKRKGRLIRETSARLSGIKTLGADADILVLKELENRDPTQPVIEPVPAKAVAVPDILAALQQERSALTPEDIHDRLESLRPKIDAGPDEPLYVSLKVFVKLMRNLSDGFTQQQLSKFYSTSKNIQQASYHKEVLASLKGMTATAKRPFTRTDWQPETTPLAKRLPGADVPTKAHKRTWTISKQLLVDRIIRDLWKLVPLEEVEALGELELSLKPWQVVMLTTGDETILDKIGTARRAKVEIHRQHSVLRITADKTTAEYVASDIEEALQNVTAKKLQLKPWIDSLEPSKVPESKELASLYSAEDFQLVTSLTRATIQRMDNKNTLVLRGLDEGALAEAERTLLRLLPLRETTIRTIDIQGLNDSARLLSTPFEESSLDHKHRGAAMGRWLYPISRQARTEIEKDHQENSVHLHTTETSTIRKARVATIMDKFRQSTTAEEPKIANVGPWVMPPTFELSATFGQALFPSDELASSGTFESKTYVSSQPVFTPNVSGITTLLSSANAQDPSASRIFRVESQPNAPSLIYEFIPAPEQHPASANQILPSLRIKMQTTATGTEATFHRLYLCVQEHFHTVLLPEEVADFQLLRSLRLTLRKGIRIKAIDEWVSTVKANIASGQRISAPDLSIDIPGWAIAGQPAKGQNTRTVKYLFSGVRFRQTAAGTFQGMPVTYSTNRSGRLGPRGGSLNMHYTHSAQDMQAPSDGEDKMASFVERCLMFAKHISQAASNTQPVVKIGKMRNMESVRKARRQEEQAIAATQADETGMDSTVPDAAVTTQESLATESMPTNDFVSTAGTTEVVNECPDQLETKEEVPALDTEALEVKAKNDSTAGEDDSSPRPDADNGTVSSSEKAVSQDNYAPPGHQDSVVKAQT